jgi:uncharacterized membrane protein
VSGLEELKRTIFCYLVIISDLLFSCFDTVQEPAFDSGGKGSKSFEKTKNIFKLFSNSFDPMPRIM